MTLADIQRAVGVKPDGVLGPVTLNAIGKALGLAKPPAPANDGKPLRRQINGEGLALIKEFEGLKLKAYVCPAGVLTIGYGSTGPHVKPGMVITEAQAEELLRSDLRRFEDAVTDVCPVATDNQFSAMVCLAFNIGEAAFARSTLAKLHNAGDHESAALQFARWSKAGGRELLGLARRRVREAALYKKGSA